MVRLAVISDTHFGDKPCLIDPSQNNAYYNKLKNAVKKGKAPYLDYLVLAGDVFDCSMAGYTGAFEAARPFFKQVKKDRLAKQIILVTGNHCFSIWNTVEYQVNIVKPMLNGDPPRPFKYSVPGIIDDRKKTGKIVLPGVRPPYGKKMFLDGIFGPVKDAPSSSEERPGTFCFVYPNLYVVSRDGQCILITHGHYCEPFWSFTSDWVLKLAPNALKLSEPLSIKNLVEINFPMCQLASSGVGQAGKFTENVVRPVKDGVQSGDLSLLESVRPRLEKELDRWISFKGLLGWFKEKATDALIPKVLNGIMDALKELGAKGTMRHRSRNPFAKPDSEEHRFFVKFYRSCIEEIRQLKENPDPSTGQKPADIPYPETVVMGHTHEPVPWRDREIESIRINEKISVNYCNTGSWLAKGDGSFSGAEIVLYDTQMGFDSVRIS